MKDSIDIFEAYSVAIKIYARHKFTAAVDGKLIDVLDVPADSLSLQPSVSYDFKYLEVIN